MPVEMTAAEAVGLVDDPELIVLSPMAAADQIEIETVVHGQQVDPTWTFDRLECAHAENVNLNTLVAMIKDEEGNVLERQLRIRGRCSGCGLPMAIDLVNVTAPRDGLPGIVVRMTPLEDDPPPPADTAVT